MTDTFVSDESLDPLWKGRPSIWWCGVGLGSRYAILSHLSSCLFIFPLT